MLTSPIFIPANLSNHALVHEWSNRIAISMRDPDAMPARLGDAIATINYKGQMALALCCLEWVLWRLRGRSDITDLSQRIEAAWASTVHLVYAMDLAFDDMRDDVVRKGNPDGLGQTALVHLEDLHFYFSDSRVELHLEAIKCANLAGYVTPAAAGFEPWLTRTLAALAAAHPRQPGFDMCASNYDHSAEAAVSRAWFDTLTVPHDAAADRAAWDTFLRGLRPADNPYLRPADAMLAEGFAGTPYQAN